MRWGLRARFLLVLVVLLVSVFAAITFIIVRQNTKTLKTNLIDESKSFAALATQPIGDTFVLYKDSGTFRIHQQVQSFTDLDSNINEVEIVDVNGQQVFTNNPANAVKVSSQDAVSLDPSYLYGKGGKIVAIVRPYIEDFGIHRYAVVYGISYQGVDRSVQSIVNFILIFSVVILLASLLVWYVLINRMFLMPVARLSRVALQISQGDLNRQIKLGRNDEIGDLAGAVDTMASSLKANIAKLEELDKLKNEFMMITSHNLRTPLAIISGYLDMFKPLQTEPQLKKILDPIKVNVMRLGGFAEDMLTISTIEAGQNILHSEPTDMAPVLEAIAKDFTMMAEEKKLQFTSHIDAAVKTNLSKPHFRSALWNLLDNAYKFTDEGGQIELTARVAADRLEVSVKDSGLGIAASEIPHLFTKFHRGTDTLKYNYEGTGIGLYISKLIVEQHGGKISVTSAEGQGSTFTISLPIL